MPSLQGHKHLETFVLLTVYRGSASICCRLLKIGPDCVVPLGAESGCCIEVITTTRLQKRSRLLVLRLRQEREKRERQAFTGDPGHVHHSATSCNHYTDNTVNDGTTLISSRSQDRRYKLEDCLIRVYFLHQHSHTSFVSLHDTGSTSSSKTSFWPVTLLFPHHPISVILNIAKIKVIFKRCIAGNVILN